MAEVYYTSAIKKMGKIFNDDIYTPLPKTVNLQNELLSNSNYTVILTSVNWPKGYKHVRLFNNLEELLARLRKNKIHEYNNSTPIDIAQGYYDAECEYSIIDTMNQCNYIAFCTKPGGSLYARDWFFCFVNRIQWLSTNSCRMYYTIDVFQTLIFNIFFPATYVLREHIYKSSDGPMYSSFCSEALETGNVIARSYSNKTWGVGDDISGGYFNALPLKADFPNASTKQCKFQGWPKYASCILVTSLGHTNVPGKTTPNYYNEITEKLYKKIDITDVNLQLIKESDYKIASQTNNSMPLGLEYWNCKTPGVLTGLIDSINEIGQGSALVTAYMAFNANAEWSISSPTNFTGIQSNYSYTPKNKILLGYPYNFIKVDTRNGQEMILKYELGLNNSIKLATAFYNIPSMGIILFPEYYNNLTFNFDSGILVTNFPTYAIQNDIYSAWMAQQQPIINANTEILNRNNTTAVKWGFSNFLNNSYSNAGNATIGIGASLLSENPIGALSGLNNFSANTMNNITSFGQLMDNVSNSLENMYTSANAQIEAHSLIPNTVIGQANNNYMNLCTNTMGFNIYKMQITAEKAEQLDSYFNQLGYKVNKIKQPFLNSRKYWNYVQTIGCNVNTKTFAGANKFSLLQEFNNIFDMGVTLWHTDDIGNYSLDNV